MNQTEVEAAYRRIQSTILAVLTSERFAYRYPEREARIVSGIVTKLMRRAEDELVEFEGEEESNLPDVEKLSDEDLSELMDDAARNSGVVSWNILSLAWASDDPDHVEALLEYFDGDEELPLARMMRRTYLLLIAELTAVSLFDVEDAKGLARLLAPHLVIWRKGDGVMGLFDVVKAFCIAFPGPAMMGELRKPEVLKQTIEVTKSRMVW